MDIVNVTSDLTVSDLWLDANQGRQKDDKAFGYIGTDETCEFDDGSTSDWCGWFFTWPSKMAKISTEAERQAVIDSLDSDETARHNPIIPRGLAAEKLTAHLAKKFPANLDAEEDA